MSNITPELERCSVPVETLRVHPANVRRGNLDRIAESLTTFGQLKPIVVTLDGTIVAGNHTYRAATELLSWTDIAAVAVDMDEQTARRYLLADNRSSDDSTYDEAGLAAILEELMDVGALAGTGYTPDDVDDLIATAGAVAETAAAEFTGGFAETPEATQARYLKDDGAGSQRFQNPMRDLILLYDLERYAQMQAAILALGKQWGIAGPRDVVYHAVLLAAGQDPEAPAGEVPVVIPGQTSILDGAAEQEVDRV